MSVSSSLRDLKTFDLINSSDIDLNSAINCNISLVGGIVSETKMRVNSTNVLGVFCADVLETISTTVSPEFRFVALAGLSTPTLILIKLPCSSAGLETTSLEFLKSPVSADFFLIAGS